MLVHFPLVHDREPVPILVVKLLQLINLLLGGIDFAEGHLEHGID